MDDQTAAVSKYKLMPWRWLDLMRQCDHALITGSSTETDIALAHGVDRSTLCHRYNAWLRAHRDPAGPGTGDARGGHRIFNERQEAKLAATINKKLAAGVPLVNGSVAAIAMREHQRLGKQLPSIMLSVCFLFVAYGEVFMEKHDRFAPTFQSFERMGDAIQKGARLRVASTYHQSYRCSSSH